MLKSKTFIGSIMFTVVVPQKISENSEEATGQLDTMKNAVFLVSICLV